MIANSIPALDAGGQENFDTKLAYIGHAQFDLLAPLGYEREARPQGNGELCESRELPLEGIR